MSLLSATPTSFLRQASFSHLASSIGLFDTLDFGHLLYNRLLFYSSAHSCFNCFVFHPTSHTMPTPSSNPPAEASSPRSYSFSTCPDDVQHQQRPSWQSREAVQDHNDDMGVQPTPDASPLTVDAPPAPEGPASDDTIMYEGRSSDDPSTRSSTMSPRPQSANTAVTSPISSGPSSDVTKGRDAEIGSQLSQESSNTRQTSETETISRAPSSRRGSPNRELEWIDADAQEDELWAPSMGADFSCMRVSYTTAPSWHGATI